jgi:phosphorylcholine metabolism protein LicD
MRWCISLILAFACLFADEEAVEPPTSFTRDVLKPFFIPLVSGYHHMRESPFLNTACSDAGALESIGDFFLAPSRYVFGGKTVQKRDGKYEAELSFTYGNHDFIKTSLSILALPVCEAIGSAFKGAALISSQNRLHYQDLKSALKDTTAVSNLDLYRTLGISSFHCGQTAPCLKLVRPSVVPEIHQKELRALSEVADLLNRHGIIFWLDCGSCLGAYRYGGMIPWDDDIDLSIISNDHDNVRKILSTLDPDRFQVQDWSSYLHPKTFLKLYLKETKTLIDLYHYKLDADTKTAAYFYTFKDTSMPENWKKGELAMTKPIPYDVIFPLQKTTFDGMTLWVPHQLEAYLHYKYGENLDPTMIWDEQNQSYKKVKNHPYWKMVD